MRHLHLSLCEYAFEGAKIWADAESVSNLSAVLAANFGDAGLQGQGKLKALGRSFFSVLGWAHLVISLGINKSLVFLLWSRLR
jgi:hypothetical protein